MRKNQVFKKIISLLLFMIVCSMAFSSNVSAKSQKQKALAAYKKFLSKKSNEISSEYDEETADIIDRKYTDFAIAYIDNDDIPELLHVDYLIGCGAGCSVYTYKKGKVDYFTIDEISFVDCLDDYDYKHTTTGYIPRGNIIRETYYDDLETDFINYKTISNNKSKELPYHVINTSDIKSTLNDYIFKNVSKKSSLKMPIYVKEVGKKNDNEIYKKISKKTFENAIKKYTKSKKFKRFDMHVNNAANRKKYLK